MRNLIRNILTHLSDLWTHFALVFASTATTSATTTSVGVMSAVMLGVDGLWNNQAAVATLENHRVQQSYKSCSKQNKCCSESVNVTFAQPAVNLTNILRVALAPISFQQKNTTLSHKHRKAAQNTCVWKSCL